MQCTMCICMTCVQLRVQHENKLINVTKMLLLDFFEFALKLKSADLTQLLY